MYQFTSGSARLSDPGSKDLFYTINTSGSTALMSTLLVSAINASSISFWAATNADGDVYVFTRDGGDFDFLTGCDEGIGSAGLNAMSAVNWQNMETYNSFTSGTTFGNGGEDWATMFAAKNAGRWTVSLNGRDVGDGYDLRISNVASAAASNVDFAITGGNFLDWTGMNKESFSELQDAADGLWTGAHIRTQSHAQEALDAIQEAIHRKDKIRATLGAFQNRLENTITNLSIMAENLQASESRISDIDVATEMTEFTRNNILAQAATSMLAQANSLPQLALSLLS